MTMLVVPASAARMSAMLSRTDFRTIFYAQRVNVLAGRPNGGKSWVAMKAAIEVVEKGGRCLVLDFDNKRPDTLARRSTSMAVMDTFQNTDRLQFKDVDRIIPHQGTMAAAVQWLLTAPDHTYSTVIIDSNTAAGAPNDGRDIFEWWKKHVTPWERANLGVLVLAHIPKRDTELPPGPIGSQSKRGLLTGVSYVMETGTIWNQDTGGVVYMRLYKDRAGELPGTEGDTVVDVVPEWMEVGGSRFLNITLEAPDADRGIQKLMDQLDTVLAEYPEGVYSQRVSKSW